MASFYAQEMTLGVYKKVKHIHSSLQKVTIMKIRSLNYLTLKLKLAKFHHSDVKAFKHFRVS